MTRPRTLNEMDHLRDSGFGCPHPRHGLKLLYWFAKDGVEFNNNIMSCNYDLREGDYGFHLFENRHDRNGVQLLPDVEDEYYEVGNLSKPKANRLPHYIWEGYAGHQHVSNRDRIIVSFDDDDETFSKVYVTQHQGRSQYDPDSTFCISRGLLKLIQKMELETFLSEAGY